MPRALFGYRQSAVRRLFAEARQRAAERRARLERQLQDLQRQLEHLRQDVGERETGIRRQADAQRRAEATLQRRVPGARPEVEAALAGSDQEVEALVARLEQARRRLNEHTAILRFARSGLRMHVADVMRRLDADAGPRSAGRPDEGRGSPAGSEQARTAMDPGTPARTQTVGTAGDTGGESGPAALAGADAAEASDASAPDVQPRKWVQAR